MDEREESVESLTRHLADVDKDLPKFVAKPQFDLGRSLNTTAILITVIPVTLLMTKTVSKGTVDILLGTAIVGCAYWLLKLWLWIESLFKKNSDC